MGFKNYPRDMYGAYRYLDYTTLSSISINNSTGTTAFVNAQAQTSGNDALSYPSFTISATVGARPITQTIALLYDAATQKLSENPYYVLDPLLSRLYFQNSANGTFRGDSGTMTFTMSLVLLKYQLGTDLYVSAIELNVENSSPAGAFRRIMPVALKPNSINVTSSTGTFLYSVNNQPATSATSTNTTALPNLACVWLIPNLARIGSGGDKYVSKEIYRLARLTSVDFEPHGIPGGYDPSSYVNSSVTSVRKPYQTLLEKFDYLNSSVSPGLTCPTPNVNRDAFFFINGNNTTNISPYDTRSGAIQQVAGNGFTAYSGWDLQQATNYLVTANLSFEELRIQLPGIDS